MTEHSALHSKCTPVLIRPLMGKTLKSLSLTFAVGFEEVGELTHLRNGFFRSTTLERGVTIFHHAVHRNVVSASPLHSVAFKSSRLYQFLRITSSSLSQKALLAFTCQYCILKVNNTEVNAVLKWNTVRG